MHRSAVTRLAAPFDRLSGQPPLTHHHAPAHTPDPHRRRRGDPHLPQHGRGGRLRPLRQQRRLRPRDGAFRPGAGRAGAAAARCDDPSHGLVRAVLRARRRRRLPTDHPLMTLPLRPSTSQDNLPRGPPRRLLPGPRGQVHAPGAEHGGVQGASRRLPDRRVGCQHWGYGPRLGLDQLTTRPTPTRYPDVHQRRGPALHHARKTLGGGRAAGYSRHLRARAHVTVRVPRAMRGAFCLALFWGMRTPLDRSRGGITIHPPPPPAPASHLLPH